MLAVEGHADANAGIVLHRLSRLVIVIIRSALVCLSLDDETAATSWDKALEDRSKFFGDLLEGTFYRLVFALIENVDQFFD
jgi:hypothetical protein